MAFCTQCGKPLVSGQKFCTYCGKPTQWAVAAPPPPPPTQTMAPPPVAPPAPMAPPPPPPAAQMVPPPVAPQMVTTPPPPAQAMTPPPPPVAQAAKSAPSLPRSIDIIASNKKGEWVASTWQPTLPASSTSLMAKVKNFFIPERKLAYAWFLLPVLTTVFTIVSYVVHAVGRLLT